MSDPLEKAMLEDRLVRDAARALVDADLANLKANYAARGIGDRVKDRFEEGAAVVLEEAIARAPCFDVSSSVVMSSVTGTCAGMPRAATMQAATGPFMSTEPSPCSTPSATRGVQGESVHPVSGTVSMWPERA